LEPLSSNSLPQIPLFSLALVLCLNFSEEALNAAGMGNEEKSWVLCLSWGEEKALPSHWVRGRQPSTHWGIYRWNPRVYMWSKQDVWPRSDHKAYLNKWWRFNHKRNNGWFRFDQGGFIYKWPGLNPS